MIQLNSRLIFDIVQVLEERDVMVTMVITVEVMELVIVLEEEAEGIIDAIIEEIKQGIHILYISLIRSSIRWIYLKLICMNRK